MNLFLSDVLAGDTGQEVEENGMLWRRGQYVPSISSSHLPANERTGTQMVCSCEASLGGIVCADSVLHGLTLEIRGCTPQPVLHLPGDHVLSHDKYSSQKGEDEMVEAKQETGPPEK